MTAREKSTPAPGGKPSAAARTFGRVLASLGGLGVLACLFLPLLAVVSPKKYRASFLMEVHQNPPESTKLFPDTDAHTIGEQRISGEEFLSSQIKLMSSTEVLSTVVRKLDLANRWNVGTPDAAAAKLRKMMQVTRNPGTNLLRITAVSSDKKEVAELANDVAQAYADRRKRLVEDEYDRDIQKISTNHRNHQKTAETLLQKVRQLAEETGITDPDPAGPLYEGSPGPNGSPPSRDNIAKYNQAKQNYQKALKDMHSIAQAVSDARLSTPMPSKLVTIHERAVEPATYSSPRVRFWLAAALAGLPCSGLFLASGLWLRRRASAAALP